MDKIKSKKVLFIAIPVVIVSVVAIILFARRDTNNYLTITDKLLSQSTGSFRYVFDVRTDKHTEDFSSSESVSDLADLEQMENDMDVDKVLEEYINDNKEFVDWSNKAGVEVVNWDYPKYKLILEGNIVSKEPLEASVTISLATNYFNDTLTDMVIKNGKTYINIEQLRYWLVNSKDQYYKTLGESLPESAKYVVYDDKEFSLYSGYAEGSEVDSSRESDLMNLYNRFLIVEKVLTSKLSINDSALTKESDIYKLNLTGDTAINLLSSIKSIVANSGSVYDTIITNQQKNSLLDDTQYSQAKNEEDNFVDALSDLNLFLNTVDLSSLDLNVSGSARTYTGGKGSNVYESSLAVQFTANDTDYSIAIQLHKDVATEEIREPLESTVEIDSFNNKNFVEDYMFKVLDHLNIFGVSLTNQLENTPATIKEDALSEFIDLVNSINKDKEGFTTLTLDTLDSFLSKYKDFVITEGVSDLDSTNAVLVQDFLDEFNDLNITTTGDAVASDSDTTDRFPILLQDSNKFKIYAKLDNETSNTRCVVVNCYILNNTNSELKLKTSDFTLRTLSSSKYPANYQSLLREYDNEFDMSKAPEELTIPAQGYIEVPLYFILSNGVEYMDLWYGETNLGVLSTR